MRRDDISPERYEKALSAAIMALRGQDITGVNSEVNRPVYLAIALDSGMDTRDLLNAPLNQKNAHVGLLAKRHQLANQLVRHLEQYRALCAMGPQ